jgi:hypothetical protein
MPKKPNKPEPGQRDWNGEVKRLLKAHLKAKGITYEELVERLASIGVSETEPNVRNKISRGSFTASFLYQCLTAIGVDLFAVSFTHSEPITIEGFAEKEFKIPASAVAAMLASAVAKNTADG